MLHEITPHYLRCIPGSCPAVYRDENNSLVIIGKKVTSTIRTNLKDKVGPDEDVIVIDDAFFAQVETFQKSR